MKYTVVGVVGVSCITEVEAGSPEEALIIAGDRELAGMCHSPFCGSIDETFHFDNDGMPRNLSISED